MKPLEIKEDIYLVGAVDWERRLFHGHTYSTRTGTTYNSYLIRDEKIALIDTVLPAFSGEIIRKISQIVVPEKIDYVIINHGEQDHSGALPEILEIAPKAKVVGTKKCLETITGHYHRAFDFEAVKTGDKISLGGRNLLFIEAPMMHWPDTMFTYMIEDEILFPNDMFGQHYATGERFDDEVDAAFLMDEAAKYYANIMWPYARLVLRKIEEVRKMNIPIKMIAPSHGIIWRSNPESIIDAHVSWSKNVVQKKVVIIYETMYGATARMARRITEGLLDSGVRVKLYDINESDRTEIITEMLDAKGFLIGSSTHDNNMLPTIAGFLEFIKCIKPKERIAAAFGSFGWSGGAVEEMEKILETAGIEPEKPGLTVKYFPDEAQERDCYEFGCEFAKKIF